MTEKIYKLLKDSPAMRWTALVLLASAMFFAYMFVDILSPLQAMLKKQKAGTRQPTGPIREVKPF